MGAMQQTAILYRYDSEIDSGIGLEKTAEKDTAAKDDITGNAA